METKVEKLLIWKFKWNKKIIYFLILQLHKSIKSSKNFSLLRNLKDFWLFFDHHVIRHRKLLCVILRYSSSKFDIIYILQFSTRQHYIPLISSTFLEILPESSTILVSKKSLIFMNRFYSQYNFIRWKVYWLLNKLDNKYLQI